MKFKIDGEYKEVSFWSFLKGYILSWLFILSVLISTGVFWVFIDSLLIGGAI